MAVTHFNTTNQTYRRLMGNGLVYRVPMFQRDYSWTEQEWNDLWQDLVALLEPEGEPAHYMGYLVLQSSDERHFDIIDGQQRITTLSLIVLAVLKDIRQLADQNIEAEANKRREEELRKIYIGTLDPVTLISQSKLSLNRQNDLFYQNYLVPLEPLPRRNLTASERLLRKGFEWFEDRIQNHFASSKSGEDRARLIDILSDRLFFTVISVTDELNAFSVFETLNARGVRLSSTDLLKNFFFSVVHKEGSHASEMRALEDRWELMVGQLGSENVPDFLRVFWNSRNPLTRQSDLFKTIRARIANKADIFSFMREMDNDSGIYAALGDASAPLWTPDQSKYVSELVMFQIKQPYALLLAAYRTLNAADFTRVLRACVVISFRYNVIGNMATSEQERAYNTVAERIARGRISGANDIIRALQPIYPTDDQFRNAFSEKQIRTTSSRNRRIVRYIFFAIERHLSNQDFDFASDKDSIEHILPNNPNESGDDFTDEQIDRCVYRIGNLTLLETAANRDIGNRSFEEKRGIYKQSNFEVTRNIESADWNPEQIASRQMWLARQATAIWRLSEFSS